MQWAQKIKKTVTKALLLGIFCSLLATPFLHPNTVAAEQAKTEAGQIGIGEIKNLDSSITCKITAIGGNEGEIYACIAVGLYYLFLKPAYIVAGWTSFLLNFVIQKLIVEMGSLVNAITGVIVAWQALRDVANIFLVFLTIYVGIATILGLSKYGNKQLLWKIALAALLVNFSITFTKGVIDVSNLFAVETYRQFLLDANETLREANCTSRTTANPDATISANDPCITRGLAGAFWTQLKITTLFDYQSLKESIAPNGGNVDATKLKQAIAVTAFMGGIMCLVMAFVFGAAAFLLIGRFAILLFLIIVSPLALVAWITNVSNIGERWWRKLLDQAFFAPAVLFLWWVAYKMLGSYIDLFTQGSGGNSLSGGFAGPTAGGDISGLSIVIMFMVIMTFLILGLVVAKQMGAAGAQATINVGKAGTAAAAGLIAANTLGRGSAFTQRKIAESMARAQEVDENGNYKDNTGSARLRRSMAGGRIDRAINTVAGAGANIKFAGRSSFAERKLSNQKNASERQTQITAAGKQRELREAARIINDRENNPNVAPTVEQSAAYNAARKTLSEASQADIETLRTNTGGSARTSAIHNALSPQQAVALAGRTDTAPAERKALLETAFKDERSALRATPGSTTAVPVLQKLSLKSIEDNADLLKNNPGAVAYLAPRTFEQILENKNNKFDDKTLDAFRNARSNYYKNLNDPVAIKKMVETTKPGDLAGYDVDFLKKEDFLRNTDTQILLEMQKNGLTKEKREAMKTAVEKLYENVPKPKESASIVDQFNRPIPPKEIVLTPEQQHITELYDWFNHKGRFSV